MVGFSTPANEPAGAVLDQLADEDRHPPAAGHDGIIMTGRLADHVEQMSQAVVRELRLRIEEERADINRRSKALREGLPRAEVIKRAVP
jgi:hypothetical protein